MINASRLPGLVGRTGLFTFYCAGLIVANVYALGALLELARADSSASHLVLIPFVTAALIFMERTRVFSTVQSGWPAGLGVFALGIVCLVQAGGSYSATGGTLSWSVYAFVTMVWGGFLVVYGTSAFRRALFPLMFLLFMVPLPSSVLHGAVQILKAGSAEAVAGLFTLSGMPYHREGYVFMLPSVSIEVADECSGIRSSIALTLAALLAGHMYLQGALARTVLVLAVLPIAILKNGVRIVALAWLATNVHPRFLEGRLHSDGGMLFFLLALVLMAPVLLLLRRFELPVNDV